MTVVSVARRAKEAARTLAVAPASIKNAVLERIAIALEHESDVILTANAHDVAHAQLAHRRGELSRATVDRLVLDPDKLQGMIAGVRAVAALDDPVGRVLERTELDSGLELHKVTVPLGVVAAIFEARPDAVTQIATLAIKSGNAVLLKAGREATKTTRALVACMRRAIDAAGGINADVLAMIEGRASVEAVLALDDLVDLVVPRGSNALVRMVQSKTRIPVLGHADGVCHLYVHGDADIGMAVDLIIDSKVQYPAACNALETVLVDRTIAPRLFPPLLRRLAETGVELRGCRRTLALVTRLAAGVPAGTVAPATNADWGCEYGALILACKIVDGVGQAISHVNTYGSGHTDAIVTADVAAAATFLDRVDSACVFHNASTRFSDGYRFGLGAEVGISTGKLHARGPVGVEGLTSSKYVLRGSGHTVAPYVGPGAKPFVHRRY